jgi:hypothetical protein
MKIKQLILCEEIAAVFNVTVYKIQIRRVCKMMDIKGLNSRAVTLFQDKQTINLNYI